MCASRHPDFRDGEIRLIVYIDFCRAHVHVIGVIDHGQAAKKTACVLVHDENLVHAPQCDFGRLLAHFPVCFFVAIVQHVAHGLVERGVVIVLIEPARVEVAG